MAKWLALAALLFSILVTPSLAQQPSVDGPVVSGSVVDADSGAIVGGAEVRLYKKTSRTNSTLTGYDSLAVGQTDSGGQFSLGRVSLRSTQLDFPFESSVSVYYAVYKDRQALNVNRVEFVPVGARFILPDHTLSPIGAVTVKIFVSTPATN